MAEEEAPKKRTAMTLRWRLFFCALFYAPAIYFQIDGDPVAAALCAVAGIGAFSGYRTGAVSIFTLLIAASAAIAVAPTVGLSQETRFTEWFGTTGLTNRFLSIGVVGVLITLAVSIVLIRIGGRLIKDRPRLGSANRWIGFGIGSVEGVAAILFFLGGLLILEPIEQQRAGLRDPDDRRGQMLSKLILQTSAKTRESRIGTALVAYNPFTLIPQLNKVDEVQQSVQVLSDPAQIQGLLQHPSIRRLQQRPEVRQVVQKLNADPEIQEILRSGRKMDRAMAMTLLSHPAVMELVDQPGFMEEATKAIQNTNLVRVNR